MTEEEIKKKAKEIAEANGRTYRDQEYGDINTEEECYDSAIEMAEYVIAETDIDEKYKIGKWFMGLIPCWVDAPSTLQAAHDHHGKNIVAIHLKNGGYRCCCVDDKKPITFSLAENTPLVEGWHNRESSELEKHVEPFDKGEISDGYHTFNELYYYRMLYNAAFFNMLPKEWVHKSKRHNDGEECFGGGWFIVIANLPTGQISNHYELKDWDLFKIPEKEVADKWDGHSPQEAAERLHKYLLEKLSKRAF